MCHLSFAKANTSSINVYGVENDEKVIYPLPFQKQSFQIDTWLELPKLHVYDFHYNYMKVKYPHANQLRLLFTDTDSLAYAVQTDDIYKDMATDAADRYDFSEYPLDHPLQRQAKFCTNERICWVSTEMLCFSLHW